MVVDVYLATRDGDAVLIAPDLEIGIRRVGGDADPGAETIGLGDLELSFGRVLITSQAAEQVDLPARRSANVIDPLIAVIAGKTSGDLTDGAFHRLMLHRALRGKVHCRQQRGTGFLGDSARLLNPCKRGCKIEVLVEGALDNFRQFRVVEAEPPAIEGRCRDFSLPGADRGRPGEIIQCYRRRVIVGADGAVSKAGAEEESGCECAAA